jgi:hypothetical protein
MNHWHRGFVLDPIKLVLQSIMVKIAVVLAAVIAGVLAWVRWGGDKLNEFLTWFDEVVDWLLNAVPSGLMSWTSGLDLGPFAGFMAFANYILPVQEVLAIFISVFGLSGAIRALRWTKSFVPTIGD